MKYIRFKMSNGDKFTFPEGKALAILTSQQQTVMIMDDKGKWTGQMINKAHVIDTDVDVDETRRYKESKMPRIETNTGPVQIGKFVKIKKDSPAWLKEKYGDKVPE